ncbi:MAG: HD domain-containing protein [Lachnospiraceae bacterium]|nr:HD domain-containing protein [Lachnospiraceae bacterium]
MWRVLIVFLGIAANVLLSYITYRAGLPFYLDTVGTITVSALGGLFPGIIAAVMTNVICSVFNTFSLFYSLIGVLIAVCTAIFFKKHKLRNKGFIPVYILTISVIGGVLGTVFEWVLIGGTRFEDVAYVSGLIAGKESGTAYFLSVMLVNCGINIVDKGITTGVALGVLYLIPPGKRRAIRSSIWKQKPLTDEEMAWLKQRAKSGGRSLQRRMTFMLSVTAFSLTLGLTWISVRLSYENTKEEYKQSAVKAAEFAASEINPGMIENFLRYGRKAAGYERTEKTLYKIRDASVGVVYLYILRIEDEGCRFIFDLVSPDGEEAYAPGEFTPFEEAFLPYVDSLKAGENIEPIESNDRFGWLLSAYVPVYDSHGKTVCYAGADVSVSYISGFAIQYLIRVLMIFSGFFVLILVYGQWTAGFCLIYPTGSMAASVEGFLSKSDDQEILDENIKKLRTLDIRTGDEIERLYSAICRMASNTGEQMRSMRHYAQATAQMQNGLIVTMADMVESRDSDTGAHVQKTSAYVRIILEGLKRKGYYLGKLTPQYMTDVENSAPLHDVGKINVPDAILNKPGKLDKEEFEIMKRHTTAGREIMEKAIDTVKGGSYLKEARNMAGYHHERWDGKGYPEGLHGEVIPLSARVMAVADVFDALTSPRVYKPAFPLEKALEIINEGAGTQFDPKCVEVFMDSLTEVKVILKKYNQNQ